MNIQAAGNQYFSFDPNNSMRIFAVWRLSAADGVATQDTFAADVQLWCGKPGDPLRVPAGDNSPRPLPDCPVESISVKNLTQLCCEVTFSGAKISGVILSEEEHNANGEWRKSAGYRLNSVAMPPLPRNGDFLSWAGEEYQCESASAKISSPGIWELNVTALRTVRRVVSPVVFGCDADNNESAEITYYVSGGACSELLDELRVDSPAPWAGSEYAVREVRTVPAGELGFHVTAKAGKICTRMIDCVRTERFAGFDDFNFPLRSVVWRSRWRVRAGELNSFNAITGSPAVWAGNNTVVTSVEPRRLSDLEYELVILAESLNNPELFEQYFRDNRSSLKNRVDVNARMADFLLKPEMAGWQIGYDGHYEMIDDWQFTTLCPLVVEGNLPEQYINLLLKTVVLEETFYRRGGMSRNIKYLVEWGNAPRVFSGVVGGCDGSFLRADMEAEEVADNSGKRWTKFTGTWQMAPAGFVWNNLFFARTAADGNAPAAP